MMIIVKFKYINFTTFEYSSTAIVFLFFMKNTAIVELIELIYFRTITFFLHDVRTQLINNRFDLFEF